MSGCAGDLACVGSTCVNLCTAIAECPPGSSCVATGDGRARCARADVDAGAPPDDAGVDAAAPGDAGQDATQSCVEDAAREDAFAVLDAGACRPPTCDPPVQLSAGDALTCARTEHGRLYCWGANDVVGRGPAPTGCDSAQRCSRPAEVMVEDGAAVVPATGVTWVGTSTYTTCFVARGRGPTCFANNAFGVPLGADPAVYDSYAHAVDELPTTATSWGPRVERIYLGVGTALATAACPPWYAWGTNAEGEYGVPLTADVMSLAATIDPPVAGASVVALGDDHGCAIVRGEVWCWGNDTLGQASGTLTGTGVVQPAARVPGPTGATELELGQAFSCALLDGGDVSCWGDYDTLGESPDPPSCTDVGGARARCAPTLVHRAGGISYRHLAVGGHGQIACAIDTSDDLWCWGSDFAAASHRPVRVLGAVSEAVVTWSHTCAISAGDVWCWGENEYGQLGRDTAGVTDTTPTPVAW